MGMSDHFEPGHWPESMSNEFLNRFRIDFQWPHLLFPSQNAELRKLPQTSPSFGPTFEAPSNAWRATPSWSRATTVGPPSNTATSPTWAATRWWPGATPTRRAATPGAPGWPWPTPRGPGWMARMGSIRCWPPCRAVAEKGGQLWSTLRPLRPKY